MNKPSFFEGVIVALVASLAGVVAIHALDLMLTRYDAVALSVSSLTLAYVWYLLGRSQERTGRVITFSALLVLVLISWAIAPPMPYVLLIHAIAVWLIRSLYHHASILAGLLDMGLSALALMTGIGALIWTNSVFLSLWSFFLVHALFATIPRRFPRAEDHANDSEQRFTRACQLADAALRKFSNL